MDTASPEIPPAAPARADDAGHARPRLRLHIPPHHPAPGEPPDFSYVPRFPAGAVERPDIAVPAEETHPLAYKLIRVLDRNGSGGRRLGPEACRPRRCAAACAR